MALSEFKPYQSENGCIMPLKCLYARLINGFYVPCGKCEFCLRNKAREWSFRLQSEAFDKYVYNCLLTYDDASLPYYKGVPSLNKVDVQLFLKRLREQLRKQYGSKLKFFLVGEYGGRFHRPHYHMILFSDKKLQNKGSDSYSKINSILSDTWRHGICDIEPLNNVGGEVNYLTAYMTSYSDGREYDKHNKPFLLMSRTGLGKNWIDNHKNLVRKMVDEQSYVYKDNGYIQPLPRYLRRKIQPEEQQIARADEFFNYSNEFENKLNKLNYEQRNDYFKKLKRDRTAQQQRERDSYRKAKVHENNTNTSKLSRRVATAEKREVTS